MVTLNHHFEPAMVALGGLCLFLVFVELHLPLDLLEATLAKVVQFDLFLVLEGFGVEFDLEGLFVLVLLGFAQHITQRVFYNSL